MLPSDIVSGVCVAYDRATFGAVIAAGRLESPSAKSRVLMRREVRLGAFGLAELSSTILRIDKQKLGLKTSWRML
jgi:hypothetical protein